MVTVENITTWGDTTPPFLRRIADLLGSGRNLPEPVPAATLSEIETVINSRRSFALRSIDRERLAHELAKDHEARGAPAETLAAARNLARPDAYLVIAGQQPGLLLGPLYTLAKCLQVVNLARQLTQQGFGTILPAFWNASEDHDHNEIDHIVWLGEDRQPTCYRADLHNVPETLCVSSIPKERACLSDLIAMLREALGQEAHIDSVISWISGSYAQAGPSLADWFDHLLWALLPGSGLLILRPESRCLRVAAQPILRREIREPARSSMEANRAGDRLEHLGLSRQIHKSESRTSFFLLEGGRRIPLALMGVQFALPDGTTCRQEDLDRRLQERPETFSTSAILRPVVQDACLPTLAAVLGPHEALYHLQLAEIYQRHEVPRPALIPRSSLTLLEPYDLKTLAKTGLSPSDCARDVRALVREVVRSQLGGDYARLREDLESYVGSAYGRFADLGASIDPTLAPTIAKQQWRIVKTIRETEALLVRRRAEREEVLRRQIEFVARSVFPLGEPQERVLGVVHFLARYGMALPQRLSETLTGIPPGTHALLGLS
jgi:bacillithiol biosynthesis cysteine-adding enzyme BshC